MNKVTRLALGYYRPPAGYFWRWAEGSEVLEWQNGTTICYREDLSLIMRELAPDGLAPLGTILLILAACQESWNESCEEIDVLNGLLTQIEIEEKLELEDFLTFGLQFLEVVRALPAALRKGPARIRLLQEVSARIRHKMPGTQSIDLMQVFDTGNLDELTIIEAKSSKGKKFKLDLENLHQAYGAFPEVAALERVIRTGLEQSPEPVPEELPDDEPEALLDQLAQDRRTKGLARLTRRVMASIHIPMRSSGTNDRPLGGISDITNRGEFDRLLLSELAYDDLSLTVRLVNNEALYLRREAPPSNLVQERIILVDTSIKLWGIPRVFAISAALACAQNNKYKVPVAAYALGGETAKPVDIDSKSGIMSALGQLDAALHCGETLEAFLKEQSGKGQQEVILITAAEMLKDHQFLKHWVSIKQNLQFLITVDREGHMQFIQMGAGNKKVLSTTQYNLDELLFDSAKKEQKEALKHLPQFLRRESSPLLFPATRVITNKRNCFWLDGKGVLAISEIQHVLFWPQSRVGAVLILNSVERGEYHVNCVGDDYIFLLVNDKQNKTLILYSLDVEANQVNRFDPLVLESSVYQVVTKGTSFYLSTSAGAFMLDCLLTSPELEKVDNLQQADFFRRHARRASDFPVSEVKKHINNGYNVLQHVRRIFVNEEGFLCLDGRVLKLGLPNTGLQLVTNNAPAVPPLTARFGDTRFDLLGNKLLSFRKAEWHNGSKAWIDPRGFLHLRSADSAVPELTIAMVLDRTTACWSSDGHVTGALYFTATSQEKGELTEAFYKKYIQRFIDSLN